MALSIVAKKQRSSGIEQTSCWNRDIYRGSKEALISAGIISAAQLAPQPDRRDGYTVFLPDGEPCPPIRRAWRDPGYTAICRLDDGSYLVEVTVSKEIQAWRRKQEQAANHEAEQQRINEEIAEHGHKFSNWKLRHDFSGWAETWEGTKAQLQAEGIGIGLAFPGDPGGPEELYCKCPLGFGVRVYLSEYDRARTAAGIFTAQSRYVQHEDEPKQFIAHSRGVVREVWTTRGWLKSDFYYGNAEALVDSGLVIDMSYFPGQPGRNKGQASYRKDWSPSNTGNGQDWGVTIRKRGKSGQYSVEVPVSEQEQARREAIRQTCDGDTKQKEKVLADERRQLRLLASGLGKGIAEFREDRAQAAEFWTKMLWSEVFGKQNGLLRLDVPEGCELYEELASAFQTIRDAVQSADVKQDSTLRAELEKRLKLTAARNDRGLQSILREATHLRLVRSSPDGK